MYVKTHTYSFKSNTCLRGASSHSSLDSTNVLYIIAVPCHKRAHCKTTGYCIIKWLVRPSKWQCCIKWYFTVAAAFATLVSQWVFGSNGTSLPCNFIIVPPCSASITVQGWMTFFVSSIPTQIFDHSAVVFFRAHLHTTMGILLKYNNQVSYSTEKTSWLL